MEIPDYEPFHLESLDALRQEIERLGIEIPLTDSPAALTAPLALRSHELPNRFCAQPISGGDFLESGGPGALSIRRYSRLARGGFALIWFEAITNVPTPGEPALTPTTLPAFRSLLESLKSESAGRGIVMAQLSPRGAHDSPADALVDLATLAAEAGFDGVDLTCCHGSLAESLLADKSLSIESRMRPLLEATKHIRQAFPDLILGVRLNVFHARRGGFGTDPDDFRKWDKAEPVAVARALQEAGVSILNITSNTPNLLGPSNTRGDHPLPDHATPQEHPLTVLARQLHQAGTLKNAAPELALVCGGFSWLRQFAPFVASAIVETGIASLAGFGRSAMAFPDAPRHGVWSPSQVCICCGACEAMQHEEVAIGCPVRDPDVYGPVYQTGRRMAPDILHAGAKRCHFCEDTPCVSADPLGTPVPKIIRHILDHNREEATRLLLAANPLPGLTSRLSPAWMEAEGACLEKTLTGHAVPIRDLEAALGWEALQQGRTGVTVPHPSNGRHVTIVGGGPTGIGAAVRLIQLGFHVLLIEKSASLGGMPGRVIPISRTGAITTEIDALLQSAIQAGRLVLELNQPVTPGASLDALRAQADAVLIAAGLWMEPSLGERGAFVTSGLEFLESFKSGRCSSTPPRVAVLAGSDCAMECARISKESGASDVFIIHPGERSTLHWHMQESWFATPGVHTMWEWEPLGYSHGTNTTTLSLRHTPTDATAQLVLDLVIEAMALRPDPCWAPLIQDLNPQGVSSSHLPGVYFAGAILNGGTSVAHCLRNGRDAAELIASTLQTS